MEEVVQALALRFSPGQDIPLVLTWICYSLGFLRLFPILSGCSLFRLMHIMPFLTLLHSFLRSSRSLVIFLPSSLASHSLEAQPNCRSSKLKVILGENRRRAVILSTVSSCHCRYIIVQHINGRHIQSQ